MFWKNLFYIFLFIVFLPLNGFAEDKFKNQLSITEEYENFDAQQGPRTSINGVFYFRELWNLQPHTTTWFIKTMTKSQIASSPSINQLNGLTLEYKNDENFIDGDISEFRDLYTVMSSYLYGSYKFSKKIKAEGKMGVNQQSFLNNFMVAGAMQNMLFASMTYQRTDYDWFVGSVEGDLFYTQNHTFLGNAKVLNVEYDYQFRAEYPDFTGALLAGGTQYLSSNKMLSGKARRLVPHSEIANASLFIPDSYEEIGLNIRFGDKIQSDYTKQFRPYLSVTLYYYFPSHTTGNEIILGIGTSIFGKDKFSAYVSQVTNTGAQSLDDRIAGIQYQLFWI